MPEFRTIFNEYLQTVKNDIIITLDSQHRNASYEARNTLRVVANQFLKAELRGESYIQYLITGVGSQPSTLPPVQNIMDWMINKGIHPLRRGKVVPRTEANIKRSAYGIAKKIKDEGTDIKAIGQPGINLDEIINENMPELLKDMGTEMVLEFTDKLTLRR